MDAECPYVQPRKMLIAKKEKMMPVFRLTNK